MSDEDEYEPDDCTWPALLCACGRAAAAAAAAVLIPSCLWTWLCPLWSGPSHRHAVPAFFVVFCALHVPTEARSVLTMLMLTGDADGPVAALVTLPGLVSRALARAAGQRGGPDAGGGLGRPRRARGHAGACPMGGLPRRNGDTQEVEESPADDAEPAGEEGEEEDVRGGGGLWHVTQPFCSRMWRATWRCCSSWGCWAPSPRRRSPTSRRCATAVVSFV